MNYMDIKEEFERFEVYYNNWAKGKVKLFNLIPFIYIGVDASYNQAFSTEDTVYPSYVGYIFTIGWLWFDMYIQLNFKTNKPIED